MPDVPLKDLCRYVLIGFIIAAYYCIYTGSSVATLFSQGDTAIGILALVSGPLLYLMYRLIYKFLLLRIKDWWRPGYRKWLTEKYALADSDQAEQVYRLLRDYHFGEKHASRDLVASILHLGYMSSISALAFFIVGVVAKWMSAGGEMAYPDTRVLFLALSFFVYVATLWNDCIFERTELVHIKHLDENLRQKAVMACKPDPDDALDSKAA